MKEKIDTRMTSNDAQNEAIRIREKAGVNPSVEDLNKANKEVDKENAALWDIGELVAEAYGKEYAEINYKNPEKFPGSFVQLMIKAKELKRDEFLAPFPEDIMLKYINNGLGIISQENTILGLGGPDYVSTLEGVIEQNLPFSKNEAISKLKEYIQKQIETSKMYRDSGSEWIRKESGKYWDHAEKGKELLKRLEVE